MRYGASGALWRIGITLPRAGMPAIRCGGVATGPAGRRRPIELLRSCLCDGGGEAEEDVFFDELALFHGAGLAFLQVGDDALNVFVVDGGP